ncbi:TetR/AcrR family transcriptional regulator [uncultured Tateyamaria sp.]|uniref:TetR/AcrR family transcriptional regulator n=1 Tax=uncultured Tateyamaria sp. TaxID=455651 RepID=UPI00263483FD|nr:TetR/AcrR family transcriptional regulator [uncultured Tateyamaria sp.]
MSKRLTREAWISHGFDVLRSTGHEALKADTLCKALGVSRGSFYWHFPSLGEFHDALLVAWRQRNTEAVIAELQEHPDAETQLATLIQKAIETPQPLENAMRRWGGANPDVASALAQVDLLRRTYLVELLMGAGVSAAVAQDRATLLTWSFVGRSFAPMFVADTSPKVAVEMSALFLSKPAGETL